MSSEPYLVAHLVRGEPAFDIAIKIQCAVCQGDAIEQREDGPTIVCDECEGEGHWWIIPTSGHRAYPYWSESLDSFATSSMDTGCNKLDYIPSPPSGPWPDHYAPTRPLPKPPGALAGLLGRLGLAKPILRRL